VPRALDLYPFQISTFINSGVNHAKLFHFPKYLPSLSPFSVTVLTDHCIVFNKALLSLYHRVEPPRVWLLCILESSIRNITSISPPPPCHNHLLLPHLISSLFCLLREFIFLLPALPIGTLPTDISTPPMWS
jgi:hypothetical protein